MRIVLLAASLTLLAACGGPETSQANNSAANVSNDAQPEATANASNAMVLLAPVANKEQALKVMHERHEGMEAVGKNTKTLKRELEGSAPNLATVRQSAAAMADLSRKASGWFPKGTGPDVGKTGAKPEIWQNSQDFAAKLAGFQKAAQALNAAARGTDVAAMKDRFADLGGSCKACHDKYRAEMKH